MGHIIRSIIIVSILCFYAASCEQEVFVEPNLDIINSHSKIFINSKPDGAKIYIAGKNTGFVTPDTINWIPEGKYDITLKKELFFDTSFVLNAKLDSTTGILIDYYKNPRMLGNLVCLSFPSGADIYLDDEVTGHKTPYTFKNIIPKKYSVVYSYPEHRKDSTMASVASRSSYQVYLTLEDTLDVVTYKKENSNLHTNQIKSAAEDNEGNIWFGTAIEGLSMFDGKKFHTYKKSNTPSMPSDYMRDVRKDHSGNLWIGFASALSKKNRNNWDAYPSNFINSIHIGYDNTILAAVDRGGIIKYKDGAYTRLTSENSLLRSNDAVSVCLDANNKMWVGLREREINVFDGSKWVYLDSASGKIPFPNNSAIERTSDGSIYAIFYRTIPNPPKGMPMPPTLYTLEKYENGKWVRLYSETTQIKDKNIYVDGKDIVWLSFNEIFRVRDKNIVESINNIIKIDKIRRFNNAYLARTFLLGERVFVDSKENLWIIGGYNGLVKIKKGRWNY